MAEKVVRLLVDDIDGTELAEGKGEKIEFSLRGTSYTIDLSDSNAAKFDKAVAPFVNAAAKVSGGRGRPKGARARASSGSGYSTETLASIRQWAAKNDHTVSTRGRIAQTVIDAWESGHQKA